MSVHLRLLSGDLLTFSTFEDYKFSNLCSEFYSLMADDLSIEDLNCIIIFDGENEVTLTDRVVNDKIYNVFVQEPYIKIIYHFGISRNNIIYQHRYKHFPRNPVVIITRSIVDNQQQSYDYMYRSLVNLFHDTIDIHLYEDDEEPLTFREYINVNYNDNYELSLEELITEYIKYDILKSVSIKRFIYED